MALPGFTEPWPRTSVLVPCDHEKRPRVASTTGGLADTYSGGIDMSERTCSIPECAKPAKTRGWCSMHYTRWHRHGDPLYTAISAEDEPLLGRLLRHVDASGDCWEWSSALSSTGYAHISVAKVKYMAHRYVWEQLVGPIPDGHHLDHLCRNRACVNPDHLEPVPPSVNFLRGALVQSMRSQTHCVNGHPYEGDNYRLLPSGRRQCRMCRREWQRRDYWRRKQ